VVGFQSFELLLAKRNISGSDKYEANIKVLIHLKKQIFITKLRKK
jgi:hypothetical protein